MIALGLALLALFVGLALLTPRVRARRRRGPAADALPGDESASLEERARWARAARRRLNGVDSHDSEPPKGAA